MTYIGIISHDLTGIKDFDGLETLFEIVIIFLFLIFLTIKLVTLLCGSNSLTSLIVNNNTNLENLNCLGN